MGTRPARGALRGAGQQSARTVARLPGNRTRAVPQLEVWTLRLPEPETRHLDLSLLPRAGRRLHAGHATPRLLLRPGGRLAHGAVRAALRTSPTAQAADPRGGGRMSVRLIA